MGRPRKIILNPPQPEPGTGTISPAADDETNNANTPLDATTDVDIDTSKPPTDMDGSEGEAEPEEEEAREAEEAEEEEEDEEPLPIPAPAPVIKRKRGRPPRNPALFTPAKAATPFVDGAEDDDQGGLPASATPATGKKRRGRPPVRGSVKSRGGPSHVTAVPLDKEGNPQVVENDEIVLPPDPAGETKVTANGQLLGGREYRCRTFTIKGRGERLYMLSTEPARCIGFRDSYLFFQKHKQLFKIIMDDDEKYDMIARNLIPHSYKGRAIGVVTARSVFREFGARIVVGGRRVVDDYWEAKAREEGAVEGELADPDDKIPQGGLKEYNRNQYVAWHGASSVYHTGQPSVPLQMQSERHQGRMREKMLLGAGGVGGPGSRGGAGGRSMVITDENWMLEHARAASQFNSELRAERERGAEVGLYEQHTNLMFWPEATQSTRVKWERIAHANGDRGQRGGGEVQLPRGVYTVTHAIRSPKGWVPSYPYKSAPYSGHGMSEVSEEVLEALRNQFGDELVRKVKEQAEVERQWEESWRTVSQSRETAESG
ncbi:chromatin remodelling complex Rsc7/Swp82 subunit-domain-containing protein [Tirmania nivea]|nr:chromatin remodelling complex Rsc7/Swp82 subunit-domain-containing protein [Tirmania nivea]